MSSYTEGQTHQLMNALEAAGFTPGDLTKLGQRKDLGTIRGFVLGTHEIKSTSKVTINRGRFNPVGFLGEGWRILYYDETDARSIALTELDLIKVQLVTIFSDGELSITGEERLKRLKASDYIRLDADIFFTLWENQHLIPESWKKVNGKTRYIFFDGTILRSPRGGHSVLYLYWWQEDGAWSWGVYQLGTDWYDGDLSAVLAR
ncbi:MAG: hypothetical protein A3J08_04130 [Candidatus Lloydbacteria bacterium RIFCSPLOWO2_02_FULL_51_11]|nr:MAG: hypothetical protein A3J08_04130 [Candidatus Lloydbacteria bacterium RIFCSPLOWO2_02_FULL_51_11]